MKKQKKDTPYNTKIEYLKRYKGRLHGDVPTLAQYTNMSGQERKVVSSTGVSGLKKLKGRV